MPVDGAVFSHCTVNDSPARNDRLKPAKKSVAVSDSLMGVTSFLLRGRIALDGTRDSGFDVFTK